MEIRTAAFHCISDVVMMFPMSMAKTTLRGLEVHLSEELTDLLRQHFAEVMESTAEDFPPAMLAKYKEAARTENPTKFPAAAESDETEEDSDSPELIEAALKLLKNDTALKPLARIVAYGDIEPGLAAAVTAYFSGQGVAASTTVKELLRSLKGRSPDAMIELMFSTLTQGFERIQQVAGEVSHADVVSAVGLLSELAKRLTIMLGVGKVTGAMRVSVLQMLQRAVSIGLEDPPHSFLFLDVIAPFLRCVQPMDLKHILTYLEDCKAALSEDKSRAMEEAMDEADRDVLPYLRFTDLLSKPTGGAAGRKVSSAQKPRRTPAKRTPAKRPGSGSGGKRKSRSSLKLGPQLASRSPSTSSQRGGGSDSQLDLALSLHSMQRGSVGSVSDDDALSAASIPSPAAGKRKRAQAQGGSARSKRQLR